ncbi:hypothetical protein [Nesterenkonia sp. HG001]|uniref:hypothetical protein n=1 Tax=Nesterenkonia sp. HG001 TaxID=2983207 RepID=UPI002AC37E7E|nr:hypothetical protein [Nesterenkonia sp. HG001]MDZ5076771.1 hypothetical protein [Nesterenkonia sp. HG001]
MSIWTPHRARRRVPTGEAAELLARISRHASTVEISARSGLTIRTLRRVRSGAQPTVHIRTLAALEEAAFVLGVGDWPEPDVLEVAA